MFSVQVRILFMSTLLALSSPVVFASYSGGLMAEQKGDYAEAIRQYTPMAELGELNSQLNLAYIYASYQRDYAKSFYWYARAAEHESPKAWNSLGLHYLNGWGAPKNIARAIVLFRRSAGTGDVVGMENLGAALLMQQPTALQQQEALHWLHKAASAGDKLAQYNLAVIYQEGKIVPRDIKKSIALFQQAASQGDSQAAEALKSYE